MRLFTCVLDPEGWGIGDRLLRDYERVPRERGLQYQWLSFDSCAILTGSDDPYGDSMVAQHGDWCAAGMVRLDNRAEVEQWVDQKGREGTDLELVLRTIKLYGSRHIGKLLGDFAFVAWNNKERRGVAACDAFAVQKLFYSKRGRLLSFASRAETLARAEEYELSYLLALLSLHDHPQGTTVYKGVGQLPRSSLARLDGRHIQTRQYWTAADFSMGPSLARSEAEAAEECRQLLADSVRQRVAGDGTTWAQLSGGLDSSSVVSIVEWLAARGDIASGLAGTVTFVDRVGTSTDERAYSNPVVDRWGVRNELIVDPPTWYDEHFPPPRTDQPRGDLHIYPRNARLSAIVRAAGGRVLLTGIGGDELFLANMLFFADWFVRGRVFMGLREMTRRATIGRVSFWRLAYRNALLPLLPRRMQTRLVHDQDEPMAPFWLDSRALSSHGFDKRPSSAHAYAGPIGRKYQHAVASMIARLESPTQGGILGDSLEVRHPLLYRPLVEFALRIPPELRARPHAHRWVFREAVRGILPDAVRARVGKPVTSDFLILSLRARRRYLEPLIQRPILADLGVLDADRLAAAFDAVLHGVANDRRPYGTLFRTLAVEAWLQIRSGRWPQGDQLNGSRMSTQSHTPSV